MNFLFHLICTLCSFCRRGKYVFSNTERCWFKKGFRGYREDFAPGIQVGGSEHTSTQRFYRRNVPRAGNCRGVWWALFRARGVGSCDRGAPPARYEGMTCHPKTSFASTSRRRWKPICCPLMPSGGGVERALDYYRRMSQASRKGAAFDDCLHLAKQWALGQTPIAERKARKKSSRNIQHGLF